MMTSYNIDAERMNINESNIHVKGTRLFMDQWHDVSSAPITYNDMVRLNILDSIECDVGVDVDIDDVSILLTRD